MQFKFTGNFKELELYRDKIASLPTVLETVNEQLAEETIELIHEGFDKESDPFGKKWHGHSELTKRIRPGGRILEDDGHLKSSWFKRLVGRGGFTVGNPQKTALWAQKGTGIYGPKKKPIRPINGKSLRIPVIGGAVLLSSVKGQPIRRMVPDTNRLPARWKKRFVETSQEVLVELFKG